MGKDVFLLGSSYYPEWWDEARWEEDFALMRELGFNAVRMGEFAWSWYEPREGEYDFAPMARAVDLAGKYGIKTIMGTTTAVCPPWLYKKYPEVKGGNIYGDYDFGGRKGQCLSSKIFLEYARKITEAQAKSLGGNENIVGWQLDNEPGFPFSDYDERCAEGFREWLKNKYTTIDNLNKAWFTMMWSNVYNDFDEIDLPVNSAEGGWNPGLRLDYRRYFSFTFNRLLKMEAEILRKYSPGRFIYTNWPGANWSVDCFEATEYLDYAAWDNYIPQPVNDSYRSQLRASMEHSFDRRLSCGKEQFLVAEQTAHCGANGTPEVISAQTWLNISHGAFATIFFEWCMPTGGVEQGYEGVLGAGRKPNECAHVFMKMSEQLKEHYPKFAHGKTVSDIAAVYSHENSWAIPGWVVDGFYDEEFFNAYGGFKNAMQRNVDVIAVTDAPDKYKVIVMPNMKIISGERVERYAKYVENGGVLVINVECGTRDGNNAILEAQPPGLFAEYAGVETVSRIAAQKLAKEEGEQPEVEYIDGARRAVNGMLFKLRLSGAEPIAVYTIGKLKGSPAVTANYYGKGCLVTIASNGNDMYFYEALAQWVKTRFNIPPLLKAGDGIIVSSRESDGREYIFATNMKDTPVTIYPERGYVNEFNNIPVCGENGGEYTLEGYETVMLTRPE